MDPCNMTLPDLIDVIRGRVKRRKHSRGEVYYTMSDADIDAALLEEVNLLRLRRNDEIAACAAAIRAQGE